MSPLIRKEIRLLAPFWILAIVLAVLPSFIVPRNSHVFDLDQTMLWTFGFGIILLGLAPFGQEFSLGTFSSFLAQPLERGRIWKTKIVLIASSALLVLGAFMLVAHLRLGSDLSADIQRLHANPFPWIPQSAFTQSHAVPALIASSTQSRQALALAETAMRSRYASEFSELCKVGSILLLIAISGGLWTTLLFRQMGAAVWFVILIPSALFVVVQVVFHGSSGNIADRAVAVVLGLYSVAGFLWARWMFANAQDSQWLGETVALLSLSPARKRAESTAPRRKKVLRALVRKELQSHQITLIVAFGLLILHVCTLVFRAFYPMPRASEFRFAVEAVPSLWLLLPWLIGCVAIAEERKLNTLESQLCLPVLHSLQFAVKLVVALLLGMALGGLMPCLIEGVGSSVGIPTEIVKSASSPGSTFYLATMTEMVTVAGIIALISFFASSLTRNTLHALSMAVLVAIALLGECASIGSFMPRTEFDDSQFQQDLIAILGGSVAIVTTICLSFFNYKILQVGPVVWLRNFLILSASLFLAIGAGLLYQPW